jgi:hypothetical protein
MSTTELSTGPEKGALQVSGIAALAKSVEVARLWVENGGPGTFIIDPDRLQSPEMFGMMMTDCVRHAARAYASASGMTEGEALERIWTGLDDERDRHTTDLYTIQESGGGVN